MSGEEDYESVSGGSDIQSEVLSEGQMEYNLKMARERRKTLKLELALANRASRSHEPSPAGSASPHGRNNGLRYHAKMLAGAFPKFPTDAEVPIWFELVESRLLAYEVPKEFWVFVFETVGFYFLQALCAIGYAECPSKIHHLGPFSFVGTLYLRLCREF
ncbi:hypothetical protein HPB48_009926 [Haemaphysalis longicornis]|uniref:Uncharacterized protein n=1 Tax=Haemaphysalis longicornis TaxID=44386 RepID=A0A9J6GU12_HAELO|nr:hypothetical protein HPB48_009926 [Haemaphysalis longicornis]